MPLNRRNPSRQHVEEMLRDLGRAVREPEVAHLMEHHVDAVLAATPGRVTSARRTDRRSRVWSRRRAVALACAVFVVGVPSMAFANALPAPIQRVVAKAGNSVGLDVPRPDTGGSGTGDQGGGDDTHGGTVREVATDTSTTGRQHGKAVSEAARRKPAKGSKQQANGRQSRPSRPSTGRPAGAGTRPSTPSRPSATSTSGSSSGSHGAGSGGASSATPSAPSPPPSRPATPAPASSDGGNGSGGGRPGK